MRLPLCAANVEGEEACFCTSFTGTTAATRKYHFYKLGFGCTACPATTTGGSSKDAGRTCPCLAGHAGFDRWGSGTQRTRAQNTDSSQRALCAPSMTYSQP